MLKLNRKVAALAAGVAGLTASAAHAAVDVSAITGAGTDVAAVGGAVFTLIVGIKVFKWVRRAL